MPLTVVGGDRDAWSVGPDRGRRYRPLSVIRSLEMRAGKPAIHPGTELGKAAGAVLFALPLPFGIETNEAQRAPGQPRFPIGNRCQPSKEREAYA